LAPQADELVNGISGQVPLDRADFSPKDPWNRRSIDFVRAEDLKQTQLSCYRLHRRLQESAERQIASKAAG